MATPSTTGSPIKFRRRPIPISYLTHIHIQNFKSYKNQTLPLAPLTLVIGANASGKSNALEAFRILSWLSQGQKLSVLNHRIDDSESIVRGSVSQLGHNGSSKFTIGCGIQNNLTIWNQLEITLVEREGDLHICQEQITSESEKLPLYRVEKSPTGINTDIRVAYNNFAPGGKKPQVSCNDQIAVMCQLESSAIFESGHKKSQQTIPKTIQQFTNALGRTLFLDPVPSLMRSDSPPENALRSDGKNLAGVLYNLWQKEEAKSQILGLIKSLPEQDIIGLEFFEDRRGKISFELVESFGSINRNHPAELLSDGTLRVLAIAAALLSCANGSALVIEEVDNGIHPSRAGRLLTSMQEIARARYLRLLLTTHNPAMMDALPDSALGDVVFCYRNPASGDSELVRLSDLHDYPGLVSQGPLGDLVTNGVVDRFVKAPVKPEQKKIKALEWLAKMQGKTK